MSEQRDIIAQSEFGMDYDQLGANEQEWVRDEIYCIQEARIKAMQRGLGHS